jgi:hypothetical protein
MLSAEGRIHPHTAEGGPPMNASRRWPALVVLLAVVGGLLAVSSRRSPLATPTFGSATSSAIPMAAPAGSQSSTWYCAAGTAAPGAAFNLTVVLANASAVERAATITWMAADHAPVVQKVTVRGNDATSVAATGALTAPIVSALVEVDGGDVGVEHAVSGASGSSVAPCATEASDHWYFANGVTEKDAHEVLALYNPFPADAVVDLSFATEQGAVSPREVQGFPIAAHTTAFVNVHDIVRRRAVAAVSVSARTGRLVVDRLQVFDGTAGRSGVSLALGAPSGADAWEFPDGLFAPPTLGEAWHVYNPGNDEAEVTLTFVPVSGDAPEPIDLTLPPHGQQTIDAASTKLVAGVAHSATVTSQTGTPVIVERAVDARKPGARVGWSSTLGAAVSAKRWVFAVGEANSRTDEWLVVHNPGAKEVTVSVLALADRVRLPIEEMQGLTVPPGGRLALRLGDHIDRSPLPILVEADGDVAVERDAYGVGRVGLSAVVGIPLRQ